MDKKKLKRGDPQTISFYLSGDKTSDKIIFATKVGNGTASNGNVNAELTGDRLIEKKNSVAGGSDTQIKTTYTDDKTKIEIFLFKADTQDFTEPLYYSDVTIQPADLSTDPVTVKTYEHEIIFDVQTDLDGMNLPQQAIRYIPLPDTIDDGKVPRKNNSDPTLWESIDVYTKAETDVLLDLEIDVTAFGAAFDARLLLKTLDNVAAGITNVHLTTTLKSNYDGYASGKEPANANIQSHISSISNPHSVTKAQVGLTDADNTSDANKPVSSAQQTALNLKVDKVTGKGLSTEDYSTAEKNKLTDIEPDSVALATVKADTEIASAITDDHTHTNSTVLNATQESFTTAHLDSIAREDALYNYLFSGILDMNNTVLSFDQNEMTIQIDEGVA